jgi:hypothetical protein
MTIYEEQCTNDYMQWFRKVWKIATPEQRQGSKNHWTEIYKNALFAESFERAEKMLALIATLEEE